MPDSKKGMEIPSSRNSNEEDDNDWNSANSRQEIVRQGPANVEPESISTIDWSSAIEVLTDRIRHLFECNVCLEVPHPDALNQCQHGHIICDDCACRVFAEARINNREALCPHCRVRITSSELCKNTVVRQALWELPKRCRKCDAIMEHKFLEKHLKEQCMNRSVKCDNFCLGCDWEGFYKVSEAHIKKCTFPRKLGAELLPILNKRDKMDFIPYISMDRCYWKFASFRIFYENVEVRWANERNHYGESIMQSKPFYAFEEQWKLVLVFKGCDSRIPNSIDYALCLQNMSTTTLNLSYFATIADSRSSSKQNNDIWLKLQNQTFHSNRPIQCEFNELPLEGFSPICRFLSLPTMYLRVWMFIEAKNYTS